MVNRGVSGGFFFIVFVSMRKPDTPYLLVSVVSPRVMCDF